MMLRDRTEVLKEWFKNHFCEFVGRNTLLRRLDNTCKIMNLDTYLTPYTKVNFMWIINLNVRANVLKLLKKIEE